VYNKADIDGAKVVWVREIELEHNRKLLDYFKDRHVWLLEPDAEPPILQPYPSQDNVVKQDTNQADRVIEPRSNAGQPHGGEAIKPSSGSRPQTFIIR
jgi:hypothetical protein